MGLGKRHHRQTMGLQLHPSHNRHLGHNRRQRPQLRRNSHLRSPLVRWRRRKPVPLHNPCCSCNSSSPVDSAVFLEVLPGSHQWLLTIMSIWWSFGQILGTLVAWPLIANYACNSAEGCTRANNMGWRYFLFTYPPKCPNTTSESMQLTSRMGGLTLLMFILRFFVFHLYESPKFLMGRGKNAGTGTS